MKEKEEEEEEKKIKQIKKIEENYNESIKNKKTKIIKQ